MNFGVLLLVISAASIGAISDDFLSNRNNCIDLLKLDEDEFPKANEESTTSEVETFMTFDPNDIESVILWKCILKMEKVISPSGQYQMDVLKKWLPEEVDFSEVETCMKIKDVDACDAAHMISKCVVEHLAMDEEEENATQK